MSASQPEASKTKPTANWKAGDYVWFGIKCAFLSLALLYLFTYAEFSAVRAIYEAY